MEFLGRKEFIIFDVERRFFFFFWRTREYLSYFGFHLVALGGSFIFEW